MTLPVAIGPEGFPSTQVSLAECREWAKRYYPYGLQEGAEEEFLLSQRRKILPRIYFVLTGWRGETQVEWERDIEHIQTLERPMVTDPDKLQRQLDELRQSRSEMGPSHEMEEAQSSKRVRFVDEGEHVYLASREKLLRERREGVQVIAMFRRMNGSEKAVGYCHGFDTIPYKDQEFPSLNVETLVPGISQIILAQRHQWAKIWRTGVSADMELDEQDIETLRSLGVTIALPSGGRFSLRRLGIGTALKYVILQLFKLRGKSKAALNVGTIVDVLDPEIRLPNASSTMYNTRIFDQDLGWRTHFDSIAHTGRVLWRAYGGNMTEILRRQLEGPNSVLQKHGWDFQRMRDEANEMYLRILEEIRDGKHAV